MINGENRLFKLMYLPNAIDFPSLSYERVRYLYTMTNGDDTATLHPMLHAALFPSNPSDPDEYGGRFYEYGSYSRNGNGTMIPSSWTNGDPWYSFRLGRVSVAKVSFLGQSYTKNGEAHQLFYEYSFAGATNGHPIKSYQSGENQSGGLEIHEWDYTWSIFNSYPKGGKLTTPKNLEIDIEVNDNRSPTSIEYDKTNTSNNNYANAYDQTRAYTSAGIPIAINLGKPEHWEYSAVYSSDQMCLAQILVLQESYFQAEFFVSK